MATSKTKKIHALHQKQKVFRQENPVISVLIWGINHTIDEISALAEQPLIMASDFKAHSKISVSNHNYNDQWLPSKFKVKEYCPVVFRDLRMRFDIDPEQYIASICHSPLVRSEGRSFYYTSDRLFVLKQLTREDVAQFHHVFSSYHAHQVETHCSSLLPSFLGLYRITVSDRDTYFLVMRNVLSSTLPLHKIYDLKGSTVARAATEKELQLDPPVYKDNDFKEAREQLALGERRDEFLSKLQADVEVLSKLKLMDYSLLVGIHELEPGKEVPDLSKDLFSIVSAAGDRIYFVGIVDILTRYSAKKMAAHTAKNMKHGPGAEISTVNPEQYARRMVEFVTSIAK